MQAGSTFPTDDLPLIMNAITNLGWRIRTIKVREDPEDPDEYMVIVAPTDYSYMGRITNTDVSKARINLYMDLVPNAERSVYEFIYPWDFGAPTFNEETWKKLNDAIDEERMKHNIINVEV